MNDTARDILLFAAAIAVLYFVVKDVKININSKNSKPPSTDLNKAPTISDTTNNSPVGAQSALTGQPGISADGSY